MPNKIELDLDKDPNAIIAARAYAETYRKTDPARRQEILKLAGDAERVFEQRRVIEVRKACAANFASSGVTEELVAKVQEQRAKGNPAVAREKRGKLPQNERHIHDFLDGA